MKKIVLLLIWIFICITLGFAQGIKFEKGTWSEILAKAKVENKIIFVDVYTTWCGPCKQVAAEVFPNEKLGKCYNQNFLNYKVDAESIEGKAFVKKYPTEGYPTFYYIDANGEVINKLVGAKDVAGFLQEADMVDMYKKYGGIENMKNAIQNGTASKEMLFDYYQSATDDVKPSALNLYLKSLSSEELVDENNLLVGHISLYDRDLMFRLANEIVKISHSDKFADKKFAGEFCFNIAFPVQYIIGYFLSQSISQGNLKWFEELLDLKESFSDYNGWLLDGDWILRSGRGIFFATPEYLDLCYMAANRLEANGFKIKMETYMTKLMMENPIGSLIREDEKTSFELLKKEGIKKQPMYADYFFAKGDMTAHNILKWTNYYWKISPSDKKTKKLCSEWVNYAFDMNPYNVNVAVLSAIWLARLGNRKSAEAILETALQKQKEMKQDDLKILRFLELNLRDVQNGKL